MSKEKTLKEMQREYLQRGKLRNCYKCKWAKTFNNHSHLLGCHLKCIEYHFWNFRTLRALFCKYYKQEKVKVVE